MKKLFSFLLVLLVVFLFSCPKSAFADSTFLTSFDITYTVAQNGITHAIFNGVLQNTSDTYYASSYTLKAGFDDMEHVTAFDTDGTIEPTIKTTGNSQEITLNFNHKAVGKGSLLKFTYAFDTTSIAKHVGNIWEIDIPGLANQADFQNFAVHLRVPNSFGQATYIKPPKPDGILDFSKTDLGNSGISLAFGNLQQYGFSLHYHLKNDNLFPITTEIALPPSTNYQSVAIADIVPRPTNVTEDADGNWLAQYSLYPSQKLDIVAKGNIAVSLTPKPEILTDQQRKLYTQAQPYWETQNSQIQQVANDLKTPREIFNYVVNHLQYDFSRVAGKQDRLGAAMVLANPNSAVCLEFTDLFIALARAAGIPAREIDGFAYTQNKEERPLSLLKDVLHAWPEYYDDTIGAWVMVDPTWQNTTKGTDYFDSLDFDHVGFVVKGSKSDYPVPAGGYKLPGQENTKDVFVDFTTFQIDTTPKLTFDSTFPQIAMAGLPLSGSVTITNVGNVLVPGQSIFAISTLLVPHSTKRMAESIPPFGNMVLPIQFNKTDFLTNTTATVRIQVAGSTQEKFIRIYPFFFQKSFILVGGIILAILSFGLLIIAARAWGLSIFRSKR